MSGMCGLDTGTDGGDGDGDGEPDPSGDGDGEPNPSGDGDGEPDPSGDGDGEPGPPPGAPCDPWLQDCPLGQKCAAYSPVLGDAWSENKCVLITGDDQLGAPCTWDGFVEGSDSCAAGLTCWYLNAQNQGTCVKNCSGSADAPVCPDEHFCMMRGLGSLNVCLPACDPSLQDCEVGEGCYLNSTGFTCAATGSNEDVGGPCIFANDCAPGNVCVGPEHFDECIGPGCCAELCNIDDPVCAPGTECVALFPPDALYYTEVGVCLTP